MGPSLAAQDSDFGAVVYRTKIDKSKVSLICGGGSGHEPSHPGFVGAQVFFYFQVEIDGTA